MLHWKKDAEFTQERQMSNCAACMGLLSCLWSFCQDFMSAGSPLNILKAMGSSLLPLTSLAYPLLLRNWWQHSVLSSWDPKVKLLCFLLVAWYFLSFMCLVAVEIPLLHSYLIYIKGRYKKNRMLKWEDSPETREEKKEGMALVESWKKKKSSVQH